MRHLFLTRRSTTRRRRRARRVRRRERAEDVAPWLAAGATGAAPCRRAGGGARRLRMIGVDAAGGEVLRKEATPRRPLDGCDRVHVIVKVDAVRRAALEGRLVVVASSRKRAPGACYVVRGTTPDQQFDELLDVLGERGAVATWGSRCGICNGCDWHTLAPDAVVGEAPPGVLAEAPPVRRLRAVLAGRQVRVRWRRCAGWR